MVVIQKVINFNFLFKVQLFLANLILVSIECIKPPTSISSSEDGATFWPEGWRKSLCKCSACIQLYKDHAVEFLIDLEDTVHFYEEKGKLKNRETDFVRGMRALNSMGHVQKVDALTEYNRMTEKLKEYLNSFVLNRQIVTEDDINRFFKGMKDERASQAAAVAPQNFCR